MRDFSLRLWCLSCNLERYSRLSRNRHLSPFIVFFFLYRWRMYLHMAVRAMLHMHSGYYWLVRLSNLSVCACALLNEIYVQIQWCKQVEMKTWNIKLIQHWLFLLFVYIDIILLPHTFLYVPWVYWLASLGKQNTRLPSHNPVTIFFPRSVVWF